MSANRQPYFNKPFVGKIKSFFEDPRCPDASAQKMFCLTAVLRMGSTVFVPALPFSTGSAIGDPPCPFGLGPGP
jgi:hypothetical protein